MLKIRFTTVEHLDNGELDSVALINVDGALGLPSDANDNGDINNALNDAFRLTQNLDGSWSMGKRLNYKGNEYDNGDYCDRLIVLAEGGRDRQMGLRSTMIGDRIGVVIECTDSGESAVHWYEVDFTGFKRLYVSDLCKGVA